MYKQDTTVAPQPSVSPGGARVQDSEYVPDLAGTVALDRVTKLFDTAAAVDAISFTIQPGEMVALLGASGSGKSTTLRMIAGLETPTAGEIRIDGKRVNEIPAHRRGLGMVPQQYGLVPHLTVAENVAFGLRVRRTPRPEIRDRVGRILDLTRLTTLRDRLPAQLSGGQQQRVALARAMVVEPRVLLLDEPLAALDRALREHMQSELKELQRRVGITTVFVTHDQQEALTLADRVGVMEAGRLLQCAPPHELYTAPSSRHVAEFMGIPNFFRGSAQLDAGYVVVETATCRIVLDDSVRFEAGADVEAAVRPESIRLQTEPVEGDNIWVGTVKEIKYRGAFIEVPMIADNGSTLLARVTGAEMVRITAGQRVWASWRSEDLAVYPATE